MGQGWQLKGQRLAGAEADLPVRQRTQTGNPIHRGKLWVEEASESEVIAYDTEIIEQRWKVIEKG